MHHHHSQSTYQDGDIPIGCEMPVQRMKMVSINVHRLPPPKLIGYHSNIPRAISKQISD